MAIIAGLTGGLASGKNFVASIFADQGAFIIDADLLAREILTKGSAVLEEMKQVFGSGVINDNGELDRAALRKLVFRDQLLLKKLNALVHPLIIAEQDKRIREIRSKDQSSMIVLNAPLLIEAGIMDKVDVLIVVFAAREIQIQRLMEREGIDRDEAMYRIDLQAPLENKVAMADYVIDNSGTREETKTQAIRIFRCLQNS